MLSHLNLFYYFIHDFIAEDKIKLVPVVEGDIIKTEEVDAVMKNDTAKRNLHTSEKWGLLVAYQLPQIIRGGVYLFPFFKKWQFLIFLRYLHIVYYSTIQH